MKRLQFCWYSSLARPQSYVKKVTVVFGQYVNKVTVILGQYLKKAIVILGKHLKRPQPYWYSLFTTPQSYLDSTLKR